MIHFLSAALKILSLPFSIKKKDSMYLFLERGEGREKEREGNIYVWEKHQSVASWLYPHGELNSQPRRVRRREFTWGLFALWDHAQPSEPRQSGHSSSIFTRICLFVSLFVFFLLAIYSASLMCRLKFFFFRLYHLYWSIFKFTNSFLC